MADITRVVSATVTKTSRSVSRQGFGTPLGVHQVVTGVQSERFKTYASLAEMTLAGFLPADNAFLWAQVVSSQTPRPRTWAIGRRIPGTKKVVLATITAPEVGNWVYTLAGVPYTFVAGALDTNETIAEGLRLAIEDDPDAELDVPAGPIAIDNFTVTAGIAGNDFTHTLTPPGAGTGSSVETVANAAPEDLATTLAAIDVENTDDWYLFNIDTRTDADLLTAGAYAGARTNTRFFIGQTQDDDMTTGTTPNIGTQLGDLSYPNVQLRWHASDTVYSDAGMLGVAAAADLDGVNGQITWSNKELKGVSTSKLTESEITNILASNGDVYVEIASLGQTLQGKAVSGEFADVQTTIAWTVARVQEAVFTVIGTTPTKIPFTDAGIARITAPFLGVLQSGVPIGHFSGDDANSPSVTAPAAADVSTADKNARILRDVVGEAILAGAIQEVILQVNLEV